MKTTNLLSVFWRAALAVLLSAALMLPMVGCSHTDQPDPDGGKEETPPVTTPAAAEVTLEQDDFILALHEGADSAALSPAATLDGQPVTDANFTYSSNDEEIVTLPEGGALQGVAAGRAAVTVTFRAEGTGAASATANVAVLASANTEQINSLEEEYVNLFGRVYRATDGKLTLDNVCTGVEVAFYGTQLSVKVRSRQKSMIRAFIDGETEGTAYVLNANTDMTVPLAEGLDEGLHTVRVLKAASPQYGSIALDEEAFATDGEFFCAPQKPELKIEVVGDSITAGAGALGTSAESAQQVENSDPTKAFAYLTAQRLGAEASIIALEGMCVKDTSICAYDAYTQCSTNNAAAYDPAQFDADIVVLALGENDMWHATDSSFAYTIEQLQQDYADMLRLIRQYHPQAHIVCMFGMMPASSTPQAKSTFQAAIDDTGDGNISCLQVRPNTEGANSHPDGAAHEFYATWLIEHLESL